MLEKTSASKIVLNICESFGCSNDNHETRSAAKDVSQAVDVLWAIGPFGGDNAGDVGWRVSGFGGQAARLESPVRPDRDVETNIAEQEGDQECNSEAEASRVSGSMPGDEDGRSQQVAPDEARVRRHGDESDGEEIANGKVHSRKMKLSRLE